MAKNLKFCTSERVDQLWMAIMQLATSYYELRTETSSLKANLEDAVNEAMQQRIGKKFEFSPREMPVTANHPVFGKQRRDSHPDIGQFDAMEHLKGRDGFRLYFFWHKESKRIFISAFPEHLPSVSKP